MVPLRVHVPDANYHQNLISCQVACPVHTDARGYVRAIADGRFEERLPGPWAKLIPPGSKLVSITFPPEIQARMDKRALDK